MCYFLTVNCNAGWITLQLPQPKGGKQLNCNNMGDREDDVVYKMDLCVFVLVRGDLFLESDFEDGAVHCIL